MARQAKAAPGLMTELDQARLRAGLSRTQLAEKARIARSTLITALRTGQATLYTASAVAEALGLELRAAPKPLPREFAGQPLRPCGTPTAAKRHHKHGEPLDPMCRMALRKYDRDRRRARAERRRAAAEGAQDDQPSRHTAVVPSERAA